MQLDIQQHLLTANRVPIETTIDIEGVEYKAYFLPLNKGECKALLSADDADSAFIAASCCDINGKLLFTGPEQVAQLKTPTFNKLIAATLEACGMGQKAKDAAKKD